MRDDGREQIVREENRDQRRHAAEAGHHADRSRRDRYFAERRHNRAEHDRRDDADRERAAPARPREDEKDHDRIHARFDCARQKCRERTAEKEDAFAADAHRRVRRFRHQRDQRGKQRGRGNRGRNEHAAQYRPSDRRIECVAFENRIE